MKDRRDDSYGKFGKRDKEAKGKDKGPGKNKVNKENVEEVGKGYFKKEHGVGEKSKKDSLKETVAEAYAKIQEGAYPFDQCLDDNEGKYGVEGAKKVCGAIRAAYGEGLVNEDARTDAEQEGYEDGFEDAKDDVEDALKKMKVSELKAKIREEILETLSEQEEDVDVDVDEKEEVDVDVDVEDEVSVDAEGDDIEIVKPAVKAKVEVGLSPEEEIVQDSLKAAMDAADALGNEKLADQIGNTITFFTREYVVGRNSD